MRARHRRSASRFASCFGVAFAVCLLVGAPSLARACSVCFGNPDSPHTQGMRSAIFFLLRAADSTFRAAGVDGHGNVTLWALEVFTSFLS